MASLPASTSVDHALWQTVRGTQARVALGWLAWVVAVALAAVPLVARLGPAGAVLVVAAGGWLLASRLVPPVEWLRRYHVDDTEVTVMGPGKTVRRLPWSRVHTLTQERQALKLVGDGRVIRLPHRPLVRSGAWGILLARVVPGLADELWVLLEEGEQVRLAPSPEPATLGLVWWVYVPVLVASALGAGAPGLAVGVGLALLERAIALGRARAGTVTLHRTGVALRARIRGLFAAWPRACVMHEPDGLVVAVAQGASARVPGALPNFWAGAAVIQLKAQLGLRAGANVHFRAHIGEDGFAVVGEVEPSA